MASRSTPEVEGTSGRPALHDAAAAGSIPDVEAGAMARVGSFRPAARGSAAADA